MSQTNNAEMVVGEYLHKKDNKLYRVGIPPFEAMGTALAADPSNNVPMIVFHRNDLDELFTLIPTPSNNSIHPAPVEFTQEQLNQEPILRFFHYTHLPPTLRQTSKPFCELAAQIFTGLPRSAERAVALRKLLESKDAAVRASLPVSGT